MASNTVFVGGQGFSVAPSLQRGFRRRERRRQRSRRSREASQRAERERQERERQERERLLKQGIAFEKAKVEAEKKVRQQTEARVRQKPKVSLLFPKTQKQQKFTSSQLNRVRGVLLAQAPPSKEKTLLLGQLRKQRRLTPRQLQNIRRLVTTKAPPSREKSLLFPRIQEQERLPQKQINKLVGVLKNKLPKLDRENLIKILTTKAPPSKEKSLLFPKIRKQEKLTQKQINTIKGILTAKTKPSKEKSLLFPKIRKQEQITKSQKQKITKFFKTQLAPTMEEVKILKKGIKLKSGSPKEKSLLIGKLEKQKKLTPAELNKLRTFFKTQFKTQEFQKTAPTLREQIAERQSKIKAPDKDIVGDFIANIDKKRESLRGKVQEQQKSGKAGSARSKEQAALLAATALSTVLGSAISVLETPRTTEQIVRNPTLLKNLGRTIKEDVRKGINLAKISPKEAATKFAIQLYFEALAAKGIGRAISGVNKIPKSRRLLKLDPKFKEVELTPFGKQTIKNVKGVGDIDLIPPGKSPKFKVDPSKALEETKIPFKPKPKLPKTNKVQKKVLAIVKKRGDAVSGSFAQEALLKKGFTRKFKDLDILTKNREALAKEIKKKLGKGTTIKKGKRSLKVSYKGKEIADIVKLKIGEEGFAKKFTIKKVQGVNLASQKARFAAKLVQLGKGKGTAKGMKVIRDLELLTGKKIGFRDPAFRGAFGFAKKEQAKVIGKRGPLVTSQDDLFRKGFIGEKQVLELDRLLFASPFSPKTGKAQGRITRLGISAEEEAGLIDLLKGDVSFRGGKPQMFVFPDEKIFPKAAKGKGFRVPGISSELEVVLDKGFAIKKGKTLARTLIDGKKVPIIELKKIKLKPTTNKLLNKFKKGKITKAQTNKLNKMLKKETGFNYRLGSLRKSLKPGTQKLLERFRKGKLTKKQKAILKKKIRTETKPIRTKKVFPIKKVAASRLISQLPKTRRLAKGKVRLRASPTRKIKPRTRPPKRRTTPRKTPTRQITPRRGPRRPKPRPPRSPPKRPPKRPPARPPRSPPKRPPKMPPRIKAKDGKIKRKKQKAREGYFVEEKRAGKFVRLKTKPLSRSDALDKLAHRLDTKLSRTARIKRVKKTKNLGTIRTVERGRFKKTRKNLRNFKIVKGKRIKTPNTYIERKGKAVISTPGEKRQLLLNRLAKARSMKKKTKTVKRRKTSSRRIKR